MRRRAILLAAVLGASGCVRVPPDSLRAAFPADRSLGAWGPLLSVVPVEVDGALLVDARAPGAEKVLRPVLAKIFGQGSKVKVAVLGYRFRDRARIAVVQGTVASRRGLSCQALAAGRAACGAASLVARAVALSRGQSGPERPAPPVLAALSRLDTRAPVAAFLRVAPELLSGPSRPGRGLRLPIPLPKVDAALLSLRFQKGLWGEVQGRFLDGGQMRVWKSLLSSLPLLASAAAMGRFPEPIREVLAAIGGSAEVSSDGPWLRLGVKLPEALVGRLGALVRTLRLHRRAPGGI